MSWVIVAAASDLRIDLKLTSNAERVVDHSHFHNGFKSHKSLENWPRLSKLRRTLFQNEQKGERNTMVRGQSIALIRKEVTDRWISQARGGLKWRLTMCLRFFRRFSMKVSVYKNSTWILSFLPDAKSVHHYVFLESRGKKYLKSSSCCDLKPSRAILCINIFHPFSN